jgi:hypothetical protein
MHFQHHFEIVPIYNKKVSLSSPANETASSFSLGLPKENIDCLQADLVKTIRQVF